MKVDLHYGKGLVSLQIPDANVAEVIKPWHSESDADNAALVRQALNNSQADTFLQAIKGKRLCVLLEDGTRDVPFEDILGPLFVALKNSSSIQFLICTGTHNAKTPENKEICRHVVRAARRQHITDSRVHIHDCQKDAFVNAGQTSRGTEILYSTELDDADVFLVVSDVKSHYFAGYSNPIKNFVPGICAFKTTEQNHSLALDDKSTFGLHPWHSIETRRDNPLADDQLEGMRLILKDRPVYALLTISTSRQIQWAQFGPVEEVTSQAFTAIDRNNTHSVTPVPRLIVSPGGFPNDTSLYIAQRALELTRNAVTDNGEILFLAACPNGVGEQQTMENFYNRLTAPIDHVLKSIESEYKLFSHKPYKFARLIQRVQRIWMHSQIPDNLVEAAHLCPTDNPQRVVDSWLAESPDTRITIVDGANKISIYAQQ